MSTVSVRNLGITLGAKAVIRNLDLTVEEGEFLVLLGPSGCGKSTLLHSIAGLIDISAGSIAIGGQDMADTDPSQRGIGMVFQSYALYPSMTVEKNMSFALRMAGLPKAQIAARVERAAAMLQLQDLLQRKPAQLSGGQRQRVAIGRAMVREARVFLLDEPLSNLDAKLRAELRRELKLLHQRLGSTMIYVTHDQTEAMTLASRIVVMREGAVQQIGTPAEVYERPANMFVAGFLGAPAMNFVPGSFDAEGGFSANGLAVRLRPVRSGPVVLGLRPEHIRIEAGAPHAASVELVEPMGNHQVIWLTAGAQRLSCIADPGKAYAPGQQVHFTVDAQRASLFDPDSGSAL